MDGTLEPRLWQNISDSVRRDAQHFETRFGPLLDATGDALVIADAHGRIVLVNAQVTETFGYSRDELIGQSVERLLPERTQATHRSGTRFPIDVRITSFETDAGVFIATMIRDATERRHTEHVAQQAVRAKQEFLANMSHELRTPLNAIIGFSEFLVCEKPGALNAEQKEYLQDVLSSGRHLLRLINEAIDRSRAL